MDEKKIREEVKKAAEATQTVSRIPSFNETWVCAEAEFVRTSNQHRRVGGLVAAALVVGIAIAFWPTQQAEFSDDFLIADGLLNSTLWSAPTDTLMPEHQFDIYQELPFLLESTEGQEGSLL